MQDNTAEGNTNLYPSSNPPTPSDPEKQSPSPSPSPPTTTTTTTSPSTLQSLPLLDRLLFLWILLAMIAGILLGNFVPSTAATLQRGSLAHVPLPLAIGLLAMMYPILCKTRFEALPLALRTRAVWTQLALSVALNWIVAPFLMLGLAWAFLPDRDGLREGLILVGLARCIAMVLVWTGLAGGDVEYCALVVAVNSVLQMALYAPMAVFFLGVIGGGHHHHHGNDGSAATVAVTAHTVSYATVATSVAVFLGIPLFAALLTRLTLRNLLATPTWYDGPFLKYLSPLSLLGLLFTILVLFASQAHRAVHDLLSVCRVAAPLIVYFSLTFCVTVMLARKVGIGYGVGVAQGFTAASNNFELAIAVAVAVFGGGSEQALACTVGPLVEVPVLLGLVVVVRGLGRRWGWRE